MPAPASDRPAVRGRHAVLPPAEGTVAGGPRPRGPRGRLAPLLAGAAVLAVAASGALVVVDRDRDPLPVALPAPVPPPRAPSAPDPRSVQVRGPERAAAPDPRSLPLRPAPAPPPASPPAAAPAPAPEAAVPEPAAPVAPPSGALLTWAPPALTSPVTLDITQDDLDLRLEPDQDYVLRMPPEPLVGGLSVNGGDDVVLVGGEITVPEGAESNRGLALKRQRGTVHVEGLAITGDGLGEGIDLDQTVPGSVVQLQNVRVSTVHGSKDGHHADVLQTWAGPGELRVDGLSGSTTYQGLFLLPRQFGDQPEPAVVDLRRVDITGVGEHGYLLWRDDLAWPLRAQDVRLRPTDPGRGWQQVLWPRADGDRERLWAGVEIAPPGADAVPEGVAGVGYRSPGYAG